MKTKITFAALLLAAVTSSVFATPGITGKIGDATFALVVASENGGFVVDGETVDHQDISNTATLGKSQDKTVIVKQKISNQELITTWLETGPLAAYSETTTAADWSLKQVSFGSDGLDYIVENTNEGYSDIESGLFAVSGSTIVYLGNPADLGQGSVIYGFFPKETLGVESSLTSYTEKRSAYTPTSAISTTSYKGTSTAFFVLSFTSFYEDVSDYVFLTGVNSYAGSSKTVYSNYSTEEEAFADSVGTYTVAAESITNIITTPFYYSSDIESHELYSGTIKFSALKDGNVQGYLDALVEFLNNNDT
ncbi:MAG: hypothetical protein WC205_10750 [Opitutaceae bacterium]|jgi:hypothetical protein